MKKKITLSLSFIISLLPMLLNQYGGQKGVQEITGLINLCNPIGIASVILFIAGVWIVKSKKISKIIGSLGVIGIVASEVYHFLFWYVETITGQFSWQNSVRFSFPTFYFGLVVSIVMVVVYFLVDIIYQ